MEVRDSSTLMKVLAGILEDAVRALERIEKKIEDQTKIFNNFSQRIEKIEKTINNGFIGLEQKDIPSLEKNITQKINDLGIQNIEQIDVSLDQIILKLQKSIQILSIQNLVNRIEDIASLRGVSAQKPRKETQIKEKEDKEESEEVKTPPSKAETTTKVIKKEDEKKEGEKEKKKSDESLIKPSSFFGS